MRPNEEYVLGVLATQIGGTVRDGKDPPDGYIDMDGKTIAVEVSRLVEQVTVGAGAQVSRLSHDYPATRFANEIEENIGNSIPDWTYILLVLGSPIAKPRKTKKCVENAIQNLVLRGEDGGNYCFFGNSISINVYRGESIKGKKIISAVSNRYSSANIGENAFKVLKERIETKTLRRNTSGNPDEYWLALYNDYWLADAETYRVAYRNSEISHEFDRIYIVDSYSRAFALW